MRPHRQPSARTILFATLVSAAALVTAAVFTAPTALRPAHAQPPPPTRYLDLAFDRVTRTNDIVYGTAIDKPTGRPVDLKLDIYEPAGDTASARPVFVFLFGGGFTSGNKELEPRVYCEQMARRGYVAVAISYRLNQGNIARDGIPAAVSDARQAVRWLRSNAATYRLDTERIVIGGSSAGAITSLFLAYTDVERPAGDDVPGAGSDVALVMDLWGGLYNQVNDLEAGEPPLAIVHGTADNVVAFSEATKLRDRAEAVGVPFAYHPLEGKGHAPYMPIELMTTLAPFFVEQLWPDGSEGMPDLTATDRLHVSHRFMTLGRTDDASINVQRAPGAWHGTATFKVDSWQWRPRTFLLEASEAVTISHEAMATFLDVLADTPLAASLPLPTATAMPDVYSTFAFDLATGDDAIVGFTSHTSTFFRRRNKPYIVTLDGRTWMTDGDEPDRALAAIYDALGFDTLDRLIRKAELGPTAVPSAQPSATATPLPKPAPRSRVWLPVARR